MPSNFAVLVADNRQARLVQAALWRARYSSVLLSNSSVFDSPEAGDLHTLLAALVEAGSERLTRSALTGPLST
jgi:exodeoxyribonuclease V beta subunit